MICSDAWRLLTRVNLSQQPVGIQGSYNLNSLYAAGYAGQGRTIAIVDSFGYDQAAADLKTFSQAYGLPSMCGMPDVTCAAGMPSFNTLEFGNHQVKNPPDNHSPGQEASNAWSLETALDIEYAHTTAPQANILLVTTPTAETLGMQGFPNMMNAEQYVVDNHLADVVSQSSGGGARTFLAPPPCHVRAGQRRPEQRRPAILAR